MTQIDCKCKNCDSKYIKNKTLQLCDNCNYKRLHEGKSKFEIAKERKILKPKSKPIFKQTKRTPIKCVKKITGERELFIEIWYERLHYCSNCKIYLGQEPKAYMFSHDKAKSIRGDLRLEKNNITLLCFDCHYAQEFRGIDAYNKRKDINLKS